MAAATRGGIAALTGCLLAFGVPVWMASAAMAQVPVPAASPDVRANPPAANNTDAIDDALGPNPTSDATRPFSLRASIGATEIYSTNALGLQNSRSDWTTQGQADFGLHDQTARFRADVSYSLVGNYHSDLTQLNGVENYLNAISRAEIIPDHVFLSGRAFAQPTFISRLGSLDASGLSATANSRNAYGYEFMPDFAWVFGDIARSDLTLTQSGEFFSDLSNSSQGVALPFNGPQNATSTTVAERLKGGSYFGRLEWVLTASATNSNQTSINQKQRSGEADLEYHIDHNFGLIADLGYRSYTSRPTLSHGLSGIIAMGGFSFNPTPTFSLVFKAGKQYNFTSFTGNLVYQFTAASAFRATLDDVVTTPQDRLLQGLDGLGLASGAFYSPMSILPVTNVLTGPPPADVKPIAVIPLDSLALDNVISRYRTLTAGLTHSMLRTTFSLMAYGTVRDYLLPLPGFDMRQTVYGVDLSATRDLTPDLTGTVATDYSVAHEFGGIDKVATVSALLNYRISQSWSANFHFDYIDREARTPIVFANGSVSDVQIGVGMRYNF
jgi:uncharacterized protein (PEP-CTERM system associated)